MYIGSENIIEKKKQYLFPCSHHFYKNAPQLVKGKMQYVYDDKGNKYLDMFAGVSVMNCGHSNDYILEQTIKQLKQLQHTTTIYLTQPMVLLAEKLAKVLPGNITHSFFCNSGSEANEGALLLAKLFTNKNEFIYLENSLHGRTHLTMSVTGLEMWRTSPIPETGTYMAKTFYPNVSNNNFDFNKACNDSLNSIKNILEERKDKIAALIIEPIQGNGGILLPPKDYFIKLKNLLHEYGALLIVDEIQTGFGRTGKMFAIENFNTIPDIITSAKALGNGIPIAAFSTNDDIAACFQKPSASTLGGNPVSSATAIAVLDYIENNKLTDRANDLGFFLKEQLLNLKEKYPIIKDVRGLGLMLGAELVNSDSTPAVEFTDKVLESMKDKGFLIGKNGKNRNVLAFQPPLVITKEDILSCINALDETFKNLK